MRFTKMQGIGNDYIYVNGFAEKIEDPHALAIKVSDEHFGIGSDGLIVINPSDEADFTMDMFNADGGRGKMCGNGIRCVGKYVYDHGMTDKKHLTISTRAGIKTLDLTTVDGKVSEITVDMGAPIFEPEQIPVKYPANATAAGRAAAIGPDAGTDGAPAANRNPTPDGALISVPITADGREWSMTCVSMGNPHAVVPVEDPYALDLEKTGPCFEHHACFPDRVNTEFIKVLDRQNVQMRVWERGSGETWACGTGACAVVAACIRNGWTEDSVTVHLRGGDLKIRWDREKDTIFMTGPAETVCEGEFYE